MSPLIYDTVTCIFMQFKVTQIKVSILMLYLGLFEKGIHLVKNRRKRWKVIDDSFSLEAEK